MAAIAQVDRLTTGIPDEMLLGDEDFHLRTTLAGAVVTGVNEAVSGMSEVLNGSFFIPRHKDSNISSGGIEGENNNAATTTSIADYDIEMHTGSTTDAITSNSATTSTINHSEVVMSPLSAIKEEEIVNNSC